MRATRKETRNCLMRPLELRSKETANGEIGLKNDGGIEMIIICE